MFTKKPKLIRYKTQNNEIITIGAKFVYEICKYFIYKNRYEYISGKFISSDSYMKSKTQIKEYDDYIELLELTMIKAPIQFIKNYGLQEIEQSKSNLNYNIIMCSLFDFYRFVQN